MGKFRSLGKGRELGIVEQGARRAGEPRGGERGEFRRLELRQMI